MAFNTTQNIFDNLGSDAFTKVRGEAAGTGDGSETVFSLDNDNLISASTAVYTDGSVVTSSAYTIDLDDGKVTFNTAPLADEVVTVDYNFSDYKDSWVSTILDQANGELLNATGRLFTATTGSVEQLDVEEGQTVFHLKHYPITAITELAVNTASSVTDTASYQVLTEGLGGDFIVDTDSSQIRFIDNLPPTGEWRVKATYNHGYTTIPSQAEELELLMATRKMVNSNVYKTIIKGRDGSTPIRLDEIETRIMELTNQLGKQSISSI